jgi:lysophospholipase L1-like esterase
MEYFLIGDSHCYEIGEKKKEWDRCAFHGITSSRFNREYPGPFSANVIVISLGGNDERFPDPPSDTKEELTLLRSRLSAKKVIWFMTRNSDKVRELQRQISKENGDLIIDSRDFEVHPDNIHLSHNGYTSVANMIENGENNA